MLYYQPQVHLNTGKSLGVEALVRWNHPERETISPGIFIPLAEETGLIIAIGNWVIKEACKQIRLWLDQDVPFMRANNSYSFKYK